VVCGGFRGGYDTPKTEAKIQMDFGGKKDQTGRFSMFWREKRSNWKVFVEAKDPKSISRHIFALSRHIHIFACCLPPPNFPIKKIKSESRQ